MKAIHNILNQTNSIMRSTRLGKDIITWSGVDTFQYNEPNKNSPGQV